ncbi:MAG: polysaccharide deacetylase family protein [Blautia sp.]|jgi:peptidoglycan/xylan/chitin deacetylase (PgdA/CDA1 family)
MDKRVLRERMRRKRRQLMIRKIMRLVTMAVAAVLLVVLVFKGIIGPAVHKLGSGGDTPKTVEAQAQPQAVDTTAAVRMPIRGSNDAAKVSAKTVGWQQDSVGTWYQNADGSYYSNGLQEIDGKTYYFDENGYLANGWVTIDGKDSWFNDDGTLDATKTRPMVALTFDDGPGERTGELLDCLEKYDAHATFFMQGVNLEKYADQNIPKRMYEIGCELGNHSYDHANMKEVSSEQVQTEFAKVDELVKASAGVETTVVRFPYGSYNETVLSIVNKPSFMWDIDTLDWSTHDADNTYKVVMDNVSDGDIILMHDIHTESVDAALRLIPDLIDAGYKLVTVSEMAEAKGVQLKNDSSYTDFLPATVEQLIANQGESGNTEGEFIDNYSGDSSEGDFDSGEDDDGDFEEYEE